MRIPLAALVCCTLACLLPGTLSSAEAARTFNIPAGDAAITLKTFSEQSGLSIMFALDRVEGVVTREVRGEMPPSAALDRLLAGTALVAVPTREPGAYAIRREESPDPNVARAAPTELGDRPANKPSAGTATAAGETVITLSPLEVVEQNRGYYASNTMSGTRLNSKIEDLAASISLVTKEEMEDFALLDINDIFNYEAGTEGTGNYTDFSFDRNGVATDNTKLNPGNANRIRGIGPANITSGSFETSGRTPIDPIDIDAAEISRGPNSSLFGIGNAAGTVNTVRSSANLSRNQSRLTPRADSNEGYRASIDLNRVLKNNVLAIRGSAVFQHDGFALKPSGTDSERYNGMVKFRPFKSTSLTASYSTYHLYGNRPNSSTPRDGITRWREAGSPTWDPVTNTARTNGVITSAELGGGQVGHHLGAVGTVFYFHPAPFVGRTIGLVQGVE